MDQDTECNLEREQRSLWSPCNRQCSWSAVTEVIITEFFRSLKIRGKISSCRYELSRDSRESISGGVYANSSSWCSLKATRFYFLFFSFLFFSERTIAIIVFMFFGSFVFAHGCNMPREFRREWEIERWSPAISWRTSQHSQSPLLPPSSHPYQFAFLK